jgi:hypothetical protein
VPDEVGGKPFPDGEDHGGADDEFASVAFDEDFVQSAVFHEPTADERMLAAARTDGRVGYDEAMESPPELLDHGDDDPDREDSEYDQLYAQRARPWRGHARWHRAVALVLAIVMGIGVVALTFTAVHLGADSGTRPSAPLPSTDRVRAPTTPPTLASPAR